MKGKAIILLVLVALAIGASSCGSKSVCPAYSQNTAPQIEVQG